MKTIILAFIALLISTSFPFAQVPQKLSFQGSLVDPSTGIAKTDGNYDFVFTLYDALELGTGNNLWSEVHDNTPVQNGLFSVNLGSGPSDLSSVPFNKPLFLEIQVDGETLDPRISLISSAFSLGTANVFGIDNTFPTSGTVEIGSGELEIKGQPTGGEGGQIDLGFPGGSGGTWFIDVFNGGDQSGNTLRFFNQDNLGNTNHALTLLEDGTVTADHFVGDGSGLTNLPGSSVWSGTGNIYYDGGNVGIGTNVPGRPLDIKADGGGGHIRLSESDQSGKFWDINGATNFGIAHDDGTDLLYIGYDKVMTFNPANATFNSALGLGISPSASLTIGGLNPGYPFGQGAISIQNAGAYIDGVAGMVFRSNGSGWNTRFTATSDAGVDAEIVGIYQSEPSAGDVTESLGVPITVFKNNGNVGIGTSSPDSPLEIESTGQAGLHLDGGTNALISLDAQSDNDYSGIVFMKNDIYTGSIDFDHNAIDEQGLIRFITKDGNTRMAIKGDGTIGVGTITPSTTLDVNGTIKATLFTGDGSGLTSISNSVFDSGTENTFIGTASGASNTTGSGNVFLGNDAGNGNIEGFSNTFIGSSAGIRNYYGDYNTFLGNAAGAENSDSDGNTFIGANTGLNNTSGSNNTFVGAFSGSGNSSGGGNIFIGNSSGGNSNGDYNLFIGNLAGNNNGGTGNTFIGHGSGLNNTNGTYNIFIGSNPGSGYVSGIANTTESNNILIGNLADIGAQNVENSIAIGNQVVVSQSNSIVMGNGTLAPQNVGIGTSTPGRKLHIYDNSPQLRLEDTNGYWEIQGGGDFSFKDETSEVLTITGADGFVGIKTTGPSVELDVNGNVRIRGLGAGAVNADASGNLTSSSDIRLKTDITSFEKGLSEILILDPISYRWNEKSGFETNQFYSGFSAQNVLESIPEAVGMNAEGYFTLSDRPIIAALVNSVKEQQQVIENQSRVMENQQQEIDELKLKLEKLSNAVDVLVSSNSTTLEEVINKH